MDEEDTLFKLNPTIENSIELVISKLTSKDNEIVFDTIIQIKNLIIGNNKYKSFYMKDTIVDVLIDLLNQYYIQTTSNQSTSTLTSNNSSSSSSTQLKSSLLLNSSEPNDLINQILIIFASFCLGNLEQIIKLIKVHNLHELIFNLIKSSANNLYPTPNVSNTISNKLNLRIIESCLRCLSNLYTSVQLIPSLIYYLDKSLYDVNGSAAAASSGAATGGGGNGGASNYTTPNSLDVLLKVFPLSNLTKQTVISIVSISSLAMTLSLSYSNRCLSLSSTSNRNKTSSRLIKLHEQLKKNRSQLIKSDSITKFAHLLTSLQQQVQLNALKFYSSICFESLEATKLVLTTSYYDCSLIDLISAYLSRENVAELQLYAAKCLTNLTRSLLSLNNEKSFKTSNLPSKPSSAGTGASGSAAASASASAATTAKSSSKTSYRKLSKSRMDESSEELDDDREMTSSENLDSDSVDIFDDQTTNDENLNTNTNNNNNSCTSPKLNNIYKLIDFSSQLIRLKTLPTLVRLCCTYSANYRNTTLNGSLTTTSTTTSTSSTTSTASSFDARRNSEAMNSNVANNMPKVQLNQQSYLNLFLLIQSISTFTYLIELNSDLQTTASYLEQIIPTLTFNILDAYSILNVNKVRYPSFSTNSSINNLTMINSKTSLISLKKTQTNKINEINLKKRRLFNSVERINSINKKSNRNHQTNKTIKTASSFAQTTGATGPSTITAASATTSGGPTTTTTTTGTISSTNRSSLSSLSSLSNLLLNDYSSLYSLFHLNYTQYASKGVQYKLNEHQYRQLSMPNFNSFEFINSNVRFVDSASTTTTTTTTAGVVMDSSNSSNNNDSSRWSSLSSLSNKRVKRQYARVLNKTNRYLMMLNQTAHKRLASTCFHALAALASNNEEARRQISENSNLISRLVDSIQLINPSVDSVSSTDACVQSKDDDAIVAIETKAKTPSLDDLSLKIDDLLNDISSSNRSGLLTAQPPATAATVSALDLVADENYVLDDEFSDDENEEDLIDDLDEDFDDLNQSDADLLRISALCLLHSLSRSVHQLRTKFLDSKVWSPILELIKRGRQRRLEKKLLVRRRKRVRILQLEQEREQRSSIRNSKKRVGGSGGGGTVDLSASRNQDEDDEELLVESDEYKPSKETTLKSNETTTTTATRNNQNDQDDFNETNEMDDDELLLLDDDDELECDGCLNEQNLISITTAIIANLLIDFSPSKETMIDNGIIKILVELTDHNNQSIKVNCMWSLMNLAFQADQKNKQLILSTITMEKIFQLLTEPDETLIMKTLGLLRNLISNRPHIDQIMNVYGTKVIQAIIMILESEYYNVSIKEQALCILANVADGQNSKEFIMGNEDLLRKINSFMTHHCIELQIAAVYCISNLVWMSDDGAAERQAKLKEMGAHRILQKLLQSIDSNLFEKVKNALQQFSSSNSTINSSSNSANMHQ